MSIRRTILLSASAIALIAGGNLAAAQGIGGSQQPAKQPAPAEAGESSGHDAQTGRPETGKTPPNAGGGAAQKGSDSGTTGQGAAGSSGATNLTAEQRTRIGSSIRQTHVRPATNVNFNISVGTVVPRTVDLHPLPPAIIEMHPAWRGYRFILVEDEIIIIEPGTYRIVAVIDA